MGFLPFVQNGAVNGGAQTDGPDSGCVPEPGPGEKWVLIGMPRAKEGPRRGTLE